MTVDSKADWMVCATPCIGPLWVWMPADASACWMVARIAAALTLGLRARKGVVIVAFSGWA